MYWKICTCSSDFLLIVVSTSVKISVFHRWCSILERHRCPDAPEVLRMACADALCVAGVPLQSHSALPAIVSRCE